MTFAPVMIQIYRDGRSARMAISWARLWLQASSNRYCIGSQWNHRGRRTGGWRRPAPRVAAWPRCRLVATELWRLPQPHCLLNSVGSQQR